MELPGHPLSSGMPKYLSTWSLIILALLKSDSRPGRRSGQREFVYDHGLCGVGGGQYVRYFGLGTDEGRYERVDV